MDTMLWHEMNEVLGYVAPASQTTAQTPTRIKVDGHYRVVALLLGGLIAAGGTLDFKIEQANAASGGTVKAIPDKAITQLVDTNDNVIRAIELRTDELDTTNGFDWIVVTATPAVAASLLSILVLGVDPKYAPVTQPAYFAAVN